MLLTDSVYVQFVGYNTTHRSRVCNCWLANISYNYHAYKQCRGGGGGGGGASTNFWGPAVRKRTRGPTMLHMFWSFSVVSLSVVRRNSNSLRDGRSGDRIPVGARFSAPVQTGPGAHPTSCTMGLFPGVKRPGRGVDHPPPSSAEVKERVQLLPLWAFMACSRVNFTFITICQLYNSDQAQATLQLRGSLSDLV
jgi:hypothetical protein